ncbi:hypothetical protein CHAB381_1728 [Campylobacter hominis ATCC BAA-381]|uniref:Uncharacterized protein n=1 Tax=Campylobacter hominis (strain ATCC BAA-381 / DSM 21671 / CCUG 45161 / LMG 19568 / NCTC 13146 / CH001A) TaxID=360107 RepID=A7I3Z9_CAMHC|nr:hypothetical protein CHAB381_1728 [Campylobacter hominis ATCC BAA-381]
MILNLYYQKNKKTDNKIYNRINCQDDENEEEYYYKPMKPKI